MQRKVSPVKGQDSLWDRTVSNTAIPLSLLRGCDCRAAGFPHIWIPYGQASHLAGWVAMTLTCSQDSVFRSSGAAWLLSWGAQGFHQLQKHKSSSHLGICLEKWIFAIVKLSPACQSVLSLPDLPLLFLMKILLNSAQLFRSPLDICFLQEDIWSIFM